MVALALPMLIGMLGLAVDVGVLRYQKIKLQAIADSVARSAAAELPYNNIAYGASVAAASYGFVSGSGGATLTVNNPPKAGPHAGNANYVEVIASQVANTYFARVLGVTTATVSARAVGWSGSSTSCVYALNPGASGAFTANGSAVFNAQCGLTVNSSNSKAFITSGGACVKAPQIGVAGGVSLGNCPPDPTPVLGMVPVADPMAYLQPPAYGGCKTTNYKLTGGTTTIDPGVYCGGITVSGSGTQLKFNPGTYVLNGGGLQVSGGANLQGTGVTFFNTGTTGGATKYAAISLTGGGSTSLKAPLTGDLAGILFYQDRTISSTQQNKIAGGASTLFEGTMYFPTTPLDYSGGSSASGAAYTIIVADTVSISGNSAFNSDYSSLPAGSPIKQVALVE